MHHLESRTVIVSGAREQCVIAPESYTCMRIAPEGRTCEVHMKMWYEREQSRWEMSGKGVEPREQQRWAPAWTRTGPRASMHVCRLVIDGD